MWCAVGLYVRDFFGEVGAVWMHCGVLRCGGVLLVCDVLEGVRRLRSIETTRIATAHLNCLARIGNWHVAN